LPLPRPPSHTHRTGSKKKLNPTITRVEQASEFAVSEAFSLKKASYSHGLHGPVLDLETTEQLLDHDEAYVEAQELLNDWMNSKLKLELASDEDNDVQNSAPIPVPLQEPVAGFQKYKNFDDFYGYLEQEVEGTMVQDFLQHLLQSEIVNSGILEDLKTKGVREKKEPKDLRIKMELRHKQVKENRMKRQKELELLKQEKALKKLAVSEAQKQLQEETMRKALKAKKEEAAIQKQMVILRKELGEKRHLMEECLRKYFSAWYKFILDLRIKMGKARALADWKCQLKILRAWRDYSWSHKLKKETQEMENQLRDQNRKNRLAIEFNQKCTLRHFFAEWQCWSRLEMEKRELEAKKEKMRRKMAKLLEEVSVGQLTSDFSRPTNKILETEVTQDKPASDAEVNCMEVTQLTEVPFVRNNPTIAKSERDHSYSPGTSKKCNLHSPIQPKWPWQITRKHAALNLQDHARFGSETKHSLQHLDLSKQKKSSHLPWNFCISLVQGFKYDLACLVLYHPQAEMQAKEEERQRQEAAEKEAKLEKRREEKKLQQIKELEKQRRLEREQQLLSKAEDHYIKVLLNQVLKAWKRLTEQSEENMVVRTRVKMAILEKKVSFMLSAMLLSEKVFSSNQVSVLCGYCIDQHSEKEPFSKSIHETTLKKKLFGSWFDLTNKEKSILRFHLDCIYFKNYTVCSLFFRFLWNHLNIVCTHACIF
uniref:Coiled-coil domain containing 191 n=1 Tax=Naja naja TaxID=35670 RepID=A0A8C6VPG6_NAJNA